MNRCAACGIETYRGRLCNFDQRTVELVRSRRCVACTAPVMDADTVYEMGRCADCRSRAVRLSRPTRWLLHQASKARSDGRQLLPRAA